VIPTIAQALAERGYADLTPVQRAVTEDHLAGADLLVSAQTGSGKTVGFGLAIAPTLLGEAESFDTAGKPLALVIAPTRELALQVKRELAWLYAQAGAVIASCVGGMDMRDERRALDRGAHVVVATPGRLRDHIQRGSLDMANLRAIILDEADEMLDLGFREDLEFILGEAPDQRRTLMFSATVPRAIAGLAQGYMQSPVRVNVQSAESQHSDIEYRALPVAAHDAENAIINVLRFYESPNAIVFANTRAMVNRLTTRFSNRGFSVVALSGELTQAERTHALQAMRDGRARVCVATDVAARGIDLPNLELVIHAELPSNSETLLHRSGRTGRAGRKGVSVLIVPGKMRAKATRLLQGARVSATWAAAPSADEVTARDEERLLTDAAWSEPVTDREAAIAERLLAMHAPEVIAAALVRMAQARLSAPEDLSPMGTQETRTEPRPHDAFGPGLWFRVALGRNQGIEAKRLLPMLCRAGDITRDAVGAIRIQPDESYVQILETEVPSFEAALGRAMTLADGTQVTRMATAPDLPPARERGVRDRPTTDRPLTDRPTPRPHRGKTERPPEAAAQDTPVAAAVTPAPAPAQPAVTPARAVTAAPDTASRPEPETPRPPRAKPPRPAPAPAAPVVQPDPPPPQVAPFAGSGKKARLRKAIADQAAGTPVTATPAPKPPQGTGAKYARPKPRTAMDRAVESGAVSSKGPDARDGARDWTNPGSSGRKPGVKPLAGKSGGKPYAGKPGGKPTGKPGAKPGAKPKGPAGGNFTPRRGKPGA
jgi:ATP-dependent RNA helicase DeaD